MRAAIVIPARNEERAIADVVAGARAAIPGAPVVVVDDASRDATAQRARDAGAEVVALGRHLGYAGALREGYRVALGHHVEAVLQMDGDGQHRPCDLPRLLGALNDADLVLGSRFLGPGPGYRITTLRHTGIVACRWMASAVDGLDLTDPTSGLRAMSAHVAEHIAVQGFPSGLTETSLLIHLHRAGVQIREVPVVMLPSTSRSMHAGLAGGTHFLRIAWAVLGLAARAQPVTRA